MQVSNQMDMSHPMEISNQEERNYWGKKKLPFGQSILRMMKNTDKAILEHLDRDPVFVTLAEYGKSLKNTNPTEGTLLKFTWTDAAIKKPAKNNIDLRLLSCPYFTAQAPTYLEDRHFVIENNEYLLTGVFDGHKSNEIAEVISDFYKKNFDQILKDCHGNVYDAFEKVVERVEKEAIYNRRNENLYDDAGATAAVCYVDKVNNFIYTATIGDSEARIFREIDGCVKSIPLSCVRHWAHKSEAKRAAIIMNDPSIETEWPKDLNVKHRVNDSTPNVSRAIGDRFYKKDIKGNIMMTSQPVIGISRLKPGDVVIITTDGATDYATESEMRDCVFWSIFSGKNPSQELAKYISQKKRGQDDITVIVIPVKAMEAVD